MSSQSRLNPCSVQPYRALIPMTHMLMRLASGTDCKCCLGARIFMAFVFGLVIGLLF